MVKKTLNSIYVALILIFMYAPIGVLIVLSFNNSKSRVVWGGFTMKWYGRMFQSASIMSAFGTTMAITLLSALIATVIGLMASLGIDAMRKKQYQMMMFFTNIPLVNADIVTGIALMLWFIKFMDLGFSSVLIAHVTFNIPYVILCILPKLSQMDASLYEAARDLGANPLTAFFKIVLPGIMPGVLAGFFMAITMSMDDFVITYFTKGAGVNTLSTMIYGEIRKGIKPEMYALSTVLFFMILVLLVLMNIAQGYGEKKDKKTDY